MSTATGCMQILRHQESPDPSYLGIHKQYIFVGLERNVKMNAKIKR